MECQVKVVNMGKSNGNYYEVKNLGQAKLIALWHLRKHGGVAIIKIAGKGRHHFVLGTNNKLVEISERAGQEYVDLIEETLDTLIVKEEVVEIVERFYGVPTEPGTILFKLEEEKKPSLWSRIVKAVKSLF